MPDKSAIHAAEKGSAAVRKPLAEPRASRRPAHVHPAAALARAMNTPPSELSARDILMLQRSAGNRALQRMLGAIGSESDDLAPVTLRRKENTTGLPDQLKAGVENLSGIAMDDVRVHYNSSAPAAVQAVAHTKGTEIHIGPWQEKHLPHETWHVLQQKQGRVRPTLQAKGKSINDDSALEREADVMGTKAATKHAVKLKPPASAGSASDCVRQEVTQLLSFSAALTDNDIPAPRTFTETDGGAQLALAAGQADLVEGGDAK